MESILLFQIMRMTSLHFWCTDNFTHVKTQPMKKTSPWVNPISVNPSPSQRRPKCSRGQPWPRDIPNWDISTHGINPSQKVPILLIGSVPIFLKLEIGKKISATLEFYQIQWFISWVELSPGLECVGLGCARLYCSMLESPGFGCPLG